MLICGKDVVCRAGDFEKRIESVSLRPWQWELLFAFDGRTVLMDVARGVAVDMSVACDAVRALHEQGLVFITSMRVDEYRRKDKHEVEASPPTAPAPPVMSGPASENVSVPSGGIAFSLKAPPPQGASGLHPPSAGSIGFKIK